MASPLTMALEGQASEKAIETEYSYFIETNPSEMAAIIELLMTCDHYAFYEGKLAYNENTGASSRIRHYIKEGVHTYELTTKHKTSDSKSKVESNIVLDDINHQQLALLVGSSYIRVRGELPVTRTDGTVVMRGDKPLVWEIDLYVDGRNKETANIHNWVKVELEVDVATLDSVVEYIPFGYTQLISSDTQEPEDRALIDNLYSNEYDLKGSVVDMDNIGDLMALLIK